MICGAESEDNDALTVALAALRTPLGCDLLDAIKLVLCDAGIYPADVATDPQFDWNNTQTARQARL